MSDIAFQLPHGWTWASLSEICEINPRRPKNALEDETQVTFVPMAAIDDATGTIVRPQVRSYREVGKGYTHFAEGDVLFAKITPCMENGKCAIAKNLLNGFGFGTTELHVLRAFNGVLREFVYYYLRQKGFRDEAAANMTGTAGQLRVPSAYIERAKIPLCPTNEQKRIVNKIEELVHLLRLASLRLGKVPPPMRQFRQSVLSKAFRGELTERDPSDEPARMILNRIERKNEADEGSEGKKGLPKDVDRPRFSTMREELGRLPDGWVWTTLSRLAEVKGGVAKGRKFPGRRTIKAPYLRVANVQAGYLDLGTVKEIEVLPEEVEEYELKSGDILFTEGGDRDKLGRGTVWDNEIPKCIHQNHIFRARLKTREVLPEYISLVSRSPFGRDYFASVASQTVNLASINITSLRSFPIPLAPVREQFHVVKSVEHQLTLANDVEESVKAGLNSVRGLEQSVLARAFHGELVSHHPNDEPASVLLEKIRATERRRTQGLTVTDGFGDRTSAGITPKALHGQFSRYMLPNQFIALGRLVGMTGFRYIPKVYRCASTSRTS